MADRDISYEVPELEYMDLMEVRQKLKDPPGNEWMFMFREGVLRANQSPVVPCHQCGKLTDDPTRDTHGFPLDPYFLTEEDRSPTCSDCVNEMLEELVEADFLERVERLLGLEERHRDALRSFIETIFTDPKKILQVQDLDNRVRSLERQVGNLWTAIGVLGAVLAVVVTVFLAVSF